MTRSMTAFARQQSTLETGEIIWELRSLNSRYLEVFLKLPEEWRPLEAQLRDRAHQHLKRGKVECSLKFRRLATRVPTFQLNEGIARALADLSNRLARLDMGISALRSIDILRWPGVVEEQEQDLGLAYAGVLASFDQVLKDLDAARQREGTRLRELLSERCRQIGTHVSTVRTVLPEIQKGLTRRLKQRLDELEIKADPARFEQELVFQLQRLDVSEELDRLEGHLSEVQRTLASHDASGRRLDFLMQELNREANTLGSKSALGEVSIATVEIKVLIEQMREQVQNIE